MTATAVDSVPMPTIITSSGRTFSRDKMKLRLRWELEPGDESPSFAPFKSAMLFRGEPGAETRATGSPLPKQKRLLAVPRNGRRSLHPRCRR